MTQPVKWIIDPAPPESDSHRQFAGQQTPDEKLVLTASNGFFDPGILASGVASIPDAADDSLIGPDFATLGQWKLEGSSMRWHMWIENPGSLFLNTHLTTFSSNAGSILKYTIDHSSFTLTTRPVSDAGLPQGDPLEFKISKPGWHTLTLRLEKLKNEEVGEIHRLEAFGPAAMKSSLLRARWRPAACHARFSSSTVEQPVLWVMSTRASPETLVTSYSPVTTPFGYFGTSFDGRGTASGAANFSLWSYGKGQPTPQSKWSHMLAAGSPEATFGAFGHEGSGVKLRGPWSPFGKDTREVTLALRCEVARPWVRWFGYYLHPKTQRFRLYAAASKWIGETGRLPHLNPGAFVEQPGPPQRRRCGDLRRDIHRRGWMLDSKKNWHHIDTMTTGKAGVIASKHWGITPDHWFSMGMGGIPHRPGPGRPLTLDTRGMALPSWLDEKAIADLYRLPATIGPRRFSKITKDRVTMHIPLSDLELFPNERATLTVMHGPEDCLTFDRDLEYREKDTRFWPNQSKKFRAIEGENVITLSGLPPGRPWYFRVLVESPRGRIWSFETDSIKTGR